MVGWRRIYFSAHPHPIEQAYIGTPIRKVRDGGGTPSVLCWAKRKNSKRELVKYSEEHEDCDCYRGGAGDWAKDGRGAGGGGVWAVPDGYAGLYRDGCGGAGGR